MELHTLTLATRSYAYLHSGKYGLMISNHTQTRVRQTHICTPAEAILLGEVEICQFVLAPLVDVAVQVQFNLGEQSKKDSDLEHVQLE